MDSIIVLACLEVIEHMQEDEACAFGNIVLRTFCPKILIVSTPNYEYNPILRRILLLEMMKQIRRTRLFPANSTTMTINLSCLESSLTVGLAT
ncbi:hypothetical protein MKX01_007160 [Papaver californicum]|nr:hypothetical protein MKX01_007160 [Papaver californicum]